MVSSRLIWPVMRLGSTKQVVPDRCRHKALDGSSVRSQNDQGGDLILLLLPLGDGKRQSRRVARGTSS